LHKVLMNDVTRIESIDPKYRNFKWRELSAINDPKTQKSLTLGEIENDSKE
jgi:hypothetical protein